MNYSEEIFERFMGKIDGITDESTENPLEKSDKIGQYRTENRTKSDKIGQRIGQNRTKVEFYC